MWRGKTFPLKFRIITYLLTFLLYFFASIIFPHIIFRAANLFHAYLIFTHDTLTNHFALKESKVIFTSRNEKTIIILI